MFYIQRMFSLYVNRKQHVKFKKFQVLANEKRTTITVQNSML